MPNMTRAALMAYEARRLQSDYESRQSKPALRDAAEKESDLHQQIIDECRRRGWVAFYSRMDRATTSTLGQPDFVIMADGGRTLYIEAKSKTGKLSIEQRGMMAMANRLGHKFFVVRSIGEFMEVIERK